VSFCAGSVVTVGVPQPSDSGTLLAAAFDIFMARFRQVGPPVDAAKWIRLPRELLQRTEVLRLFKNRTQQVLLEEMNKRWQEALERVELAMLGVNLAEYGAFTYLTPTVMFNARYERFGVYGHGAGWLLYTKENAEYCLNFVLGVVSRLQHTAAIHDHRSIFTVMTVKPSAIYSVGHDACAVTEGQLAEGELLRDVTFSLGFGEIGQCWTWEQGGKRLYVDTEDC